MREESLSLEVLKMRNCPSVPEHKVVWPGGRRRDEAAPGSVTIVTIRGSFCPLERGAGH